MKKVTKKDIILLVATKLNQPFTEEELVVAVWEMDKEKFGLKGYKQQYPDNNTIRACLMGQDGLVDKGKIIKVGQKQYRAKT